MTATRLFSFVIGLLVLFLSVEASASCPFGLSDYDRRLCEQREEALRIQRHQVEQQRRLVEQQAEILQQQRIEHYRARNPYADPCSDPGFIALLTPEQAASLLSSCGGRRLGQGLGQIGDALSGRDTRTDSQRQGDAQAELLRRHPDYRSILADPSFRRWVDESSMRQQLFRQAHYDYNIDAADALFSMWKRK